MLKKKKRAIDIGKSEDLPEGIFGDVSAPPPPPKKKVKIRPKNRDTQVCREMFGLAPPKSRTPKAVPTNKARPVIELGTQKNKKKKRKPTAVLPQFSINYDSVLPKEAKGLQLQNVVQMTESVLKTIIKNTETKTHDLSTLMLQSVAPSVLAFDAASSYVKAVLASGLKIETEIDRGVAEVIEALGRVEVIGHYIERMALSPGMKRRLLRKFIDGLSDQAMLAMQKSAKSAEMSSAIRELDAVLVKRSERQKQDQENKSRKAGGSKSPRAWPKPDTSDSEIAIPDSVRRSRSDTPRSGGF